MRSSIYITICLFSLAGCCTKKQCPCPKLEIEVVAYSPGEYFLLRTDKNFVTLDSLLLDFHLNEYKINQYSFNLDPQVSFTEFNYIVGSQAIPDLDTISSIHYDLQAYTIDCNKCLFKNDVVGCNGIINKELIINRTKVNEFRVVLN